MERIQLSLIGNKAFCFNVDDYMKIRTQSRIIGKLIGSVVKWPRNANINGLPAIYSPYETQLLIDKGVIQLCRKDFDANVTESMKTEYKNHIDENVKTFNHIYCDKKIQDVKKLLPQIIAGKRKKAEKMGGNPDDITEESVLQEIRAKYNSNTGPDNIFTQIPTQEPFDVDFVVVSAAAHVDPLKYHVYRDLWERGNWLTSGERFGGDFLIYPGEPFYYHASHIVHVLGYQEARTMSCQTYGTRVRLSVNVNKLCVFVYEDEQTKELCYQTSQWMGK